MIAGWSLTMSTGVGFMLHLMGAAACLTAAIWLWRKADRFRPDFAATLVALASTALWSAAVMTYGTSGTATLIAESTRNLAWIALLYRMFAMDGRDLSLKPIRPVIGALVLVEALQIVMVLAAPRLPGGAGLAEAMFPTLTLLDILIGVGGLMLVHNLYLGAATGTRQSLRWSCAALAGLWAFDLNLHTIAYLTDAMPAGLATARGLSSLLLAAALIAGANDLGAGLSLRPSRKVAFRTLSLAVIGAYLVTMVGIAQALALFGGNIGRLAQTGFVLAASVAALLWLPSARLRGWLRVTAAKHLFQHRYDYRNEWLRFTRTIGQAGDDAQTLHQRVIKVIADITESPAGLLLLAEENAYGEPAARWNWNGPLATGQSQVPPGLARLLERHRYILDLDEARHGTDRHGEPSLLPEWLLQERRAWVVVPLLHFDRLLGVVVVAHPAAPRTLDWEDFDLLRIVGQQLASYLAEQTGQQALMEAARFDEFNRRIAFVVHDIKNLASQLSLLAGNAERHAEKPEFRADMLVTLRNSADKLNTMLARLVRYNANPAGCCEPIELADVCQRVADRFAGSGQVELVPFAASEVSANSEALEQALVHLVQNAVDASEPSSPVYLEVSSDGLYGQVQIVDSGEGMTSAFIRDDLFRPFASTKNGGFGVGAFEARELVRAMNGQLNVDSRAGLGTRFTLRLPIADAVRLLAEGDANDRNVEAA